MSHLPRRSNAVFRLRLSISFLMMMGLLLEAPPMLSESGQGVPKKTSSSGARSAAPPSAPRPSLDTLKSRVNAFWGLLQARRKAEALQYVEPSAQELRGLASSNVLRTAHHDSDIVSQSRGSICNRRGEGHFPSHSQSDLVARDSKMGFPQWHLVRPDRRSLSCRPLSHESWKTERPPAEPWRNAETPGSDSRRPSFRDHSPGVRHCTSWGKRFIFIRISPGC